MANITVSNDIDSFMQSADFSAMRSLLSVDETLVSSSTIYVSKSGNDANDGTNINKPKLTIASAITAAGALVTAGAIRAIVNVLDGEVYTENLTLTTKINLYAPHATLVGSVTAQVDTYTLLHTHYNAGNGCFIGSGGTGRSFYECKVMDGRGLSGTETDDILVSAATDSLVLFIDVDVMFVSEDGIGISDTTTNFGHIHFRIGDLYLAGDGAVGFRATFGSANFVGFVDHILEINSPSNTIAIFCNNSGAQIKVTASEIICDTIYFTALGGQVYLTCPKVTGSVVGDPTTEISNTSLVFKSDPVVFSDTVQAKGGTAINNIVKISQNDYDNLVGGPDSDTYYIIS